MVARAGFLAGLGLRPDRRTRAGPVSTSRPTPTGQTGVAGVWVAGNVTDLAAQVGGGRGGGCGRGGEINADLVAEETRQAVATRPDTP